MSRSHKYNSFITWCKGSNKQDKILANRKFRKGSKLRIKKEKDPYYSLNEVSNTYNFNTDGLAFYINKDELPFGDKEVYFNKLMRK